MRCTACLLSVMFLGTATYGDVVNEDFKLLASDGATEDYFGNSVSISGDTALIGARADDDNGYASGSVYVFRFADNQWTQEAKLLASDGEAGDSFGSSVFISGDTVVIGSPDDDDNGSDSGSAYVFHRYGTVWAQEDKLLASDGYGGDYLGHSVSISGDRVLVGAYGHATQTGAAYIFHFNGSQWVEEQKLFADDGNDWDQFGFSVALSGDIALIGAQDDQEANNAGSVYVFRFNGTQWVQEAKLVAADASAMDNFGFSVSISGETALIGSLHDDDNANMTGSVYVFRDVAGEWVQQQKIVAEDGMAEDRFGGSVSISGNMAVIGAFSDDQSGTDAGSAYLYQFNGKQWIQEAKYLASDGNSHNVFGISVSISGDSALIGAYKDDELGSNSGSAYVFEIAGPVDSDGDGVPDDVDNCYLYNPDQADCNENGIGDVCDVEDQTSYDCNQNNVPDECESDCDGDGLIDECDNDSDIDGDGIPDNCEEDCNGNNLPDDWEIEIGLVTDCNGNLVPDDCDLADDPSLDCDGNGLFDACEIEEDPSLDCNENGVLDSCDIAAGGIDADCDGNGLLDSCEIEDDPSLDCNDNGTLDACDLAGEVPEGAVQWTVEEGGNGHWYKGVLCLDGCTSIEASSMAMAMGGHLASLSTASEDEWVRSSIASDASLWGGSGGVIEGPWIGAVNYGDEWIWMDGSIWSYENWWPGNPGECCPADVSLWEYNQGRLWQDHTYGVAEMISYIVEFDVNFSEDCNANDIPDECDIANGTSNDANGNGIPDECEDDCNGNGVPDHWDIKTGTSEDCNSNGIPDECNIAEGASNDANGNGIPDECEVDCNANGIPDDWDINTGWSEDCNGNLIPDECDVESAIWAWGDNTNGALDVPADLGAVTKIAAGDHCVALLSDGTLSCWGSNTQGQCNPPADLGPVIDVCAGDAHTVALQHDGVIRAWGMNVHGQCDIPPDLGKVIGIGIGSNHTLAVLADGTVRAWGYNPYGATDVPTDLLNVVAAQGGAHHSVALLNDGTLRAWGGNAGESNLPGGLEDVVEMQVNNYNSIALTGSGDVVAWGRNCCGQADVPGSLPPCAAVAIAHESAMALTEGGEIICWGEANYGECDIPAELGNVNAIQCGATFMLAWNTFGGSSDCNSNGIPDECEIADGTSNDINSDGVPDECQCLADIAGGSDPGDGDGEVNVLDLLAIIGFWGSNGPIGDINFDGTVDVIDLLGVIDAWGACP